MSSNENKSGRPKKEINPFNNIFRELVGTATQQEVADKIGVSRQNVGRWLSGDTTPDINTLCKIADAYNVSTDYLLGRTPNKTTNPELQAVCEYTGLSERAVNNLRKAQGNFDFLSDLFLTSEFILENLYDDKNETNEKSLLYKLSIYYRYKIFDFDENDIFQLSSSGFATIGKSNTTENNVLKISIDEVIENALLDNVRKAAETEKPMFDQKIYKIYSE